MLKTCNLKQLNTQSGNLLRCFGNSRQVNPRQVMSLLSYFAAEASVVTCIPDSGRTRTHFSSDTMTDLKRTQIHSSLRFLHCWHPSCFRRSVEIPGTNQKSGKKSTILNGQVGKLAGSKGTTFSNGKLQGSLEWYFFFWLYLVRCIFL